MVISKPELKKMFRKAANLWIEQKEYLSEIDSRFGDGDHGVTIGKIASLTERRLEDWDEESYKTFLEELGDAVMEVGGGSAGPLYGTMIGGMAEPLSQEKVIDGALLKQMFAASRYAMAEITSAAVGDKTMMDALIPAVEAAMAAPDEIGDILKAAKEAAQKGAKDSEQYSSRFGRARSYKEQTIGTPDAGAVSTSLFFTGLCDGWEET